MFGRKARYLVSSVAALLVACGNNPDEPGPAGNAGGMAESAGASASAGTGSGAPGHGGTESAAGAANPPTGGASSTGGTTASGGEANGGEANGGARHMARFKVCQQKGFDAVEPDNLDSYQNKPGFATTAADQLAYNQWLAATVHGLGLAVSQKNDLDQAGALEPYFDGILDEECNVYSECSTLAPYSAAGKPVWDAEYQEDGQSTAAFCAADVKANIVGALFALDLDGSLFEPCSNDVGLKN